MDNLADMVKVTNQLMQFYQNESCGKCTPCREGTRWMTQMLTRIENGSGTYTDLETIEQMCMEMAENSSCLLATGAVLPIVSAIKYFRSEFEAYIRRNPNADGHLQMKIAYPYL